MGDEEKHGRCIMELHSAVRKNEIKNFAGKWRGLETITLSEVTQAQRNNVMYSFSSVDPRFKSLVVDV